ncbi:MAG TPA: amino acid transport protein [bacterium]|nr:amino acid transport protein [bacterium]
MNRYEMLSFTPATLILGGFFSLIGMAAIAYGRKTDRIGAVIGGSVLTVFPLFVGSPVLIAVIGTALMFGIWLFPE